MPRPYGPYLHGTSPNSLVQFYCIELGPSHTGDKYVLMIRDDHSNYCWVFPFPTTNDKNAANELIDWCASFGASKCFMSDGPTHFRNETLRLVSKALHTLQNFTLPYFPWSNGAVERLGRELLRITREILSELQLRPDAWPDLLLIFQSALDN